MTPMDAPPGVTIRYLPRPSGSTWENWLATHPAPITIWESRLKMHPRLLLVHTNGANGEGSVASAYNWSMAAPSNTKPHYQVDRSGLAHKFLPSDRVGIANYKAALFSLAIETADLGWGPGMPGDSCGFTDPQAEMVAQIIAWESELNMFSIATPSSWDGSGVASHTDPFSYPYWTNSIGKPCPGSVKKREVREIIMPRAREIRSGKSTTPIPTPTSPISGGDEMFKRFKVLKPGSTTETYNAVFYGTVSSNGIVQKLEWSGDGANPKVANRYEAYEKLSIPWQFLDAEQLSHIRLEPPIVPVEAGVSWSLAQFANP